MEKQDQLWPGGPRFLFNDTLFGPSTDSFLLGAFPRIHSGERVCDLGSGTGLLGLLLWARNHDVHLTNVELEPEAVELCRRSYALNSLEARHICADLRGLSGLPPAGSFDLVVSNPPYFDARRGAVAQGARGVARTTGCTIEELCRAADHLLKYGGRFALIYRCERLAELFGYLRAYRMEPKRLRFIQSAPSSAPSLFLLESKKGGNPGLAVEAPLFLRDASGNESEDVKRAYFRDKEA